jgi:hypothetical protein
MFVHVIKHHAVKTYVMAELHLRGEWSASNFDRFIFSERSLGTHKEGMIVGFQRWWRRVDREISLPLSEIQPFYSSS